MRLTTRSVTHYLLDKGYLSSQSLTKGDFLMTQSKSRNAIFHISLGTPSGLFVKQLVDIDENNIYLMQKDATAHYLIHNSKVYESLRPYLPAYYGYDPKRHVFVTENYVHSENLMNVYLQKNQLSVTDAEEIAEVLSVLHQDVSMEIPKNLSLQFFNRELPWILTIPDRKFENEAVVEYVQRDDFIREEIRKLAQNWQGNSLVHGDIKLVNFLKVANNGKANLKLVDWEIANLGEPLWDVAGFFQGYLYLHILSNAPTTPKNTVQRPNPQLWTLEACQACIQAFWTRYVQQHNWSKTEEREKLTKTCKLMAARVIQTAKEVNFITPNEVQEPTMKLVEFAKMLLENPLQTAADYLGI